jgi:hypothetical protein
MSEEAKENLRHASYCKPVGQYKDGILIKVYHSIEATRADGYIPSNVSACCLGKRKSHKSYYWKYL